MRQDEIVIVGAGIGGLVCAIELARSGFGVTVLERAERAGGKMREIVIGGRGLDAGPTVMTMRWVFDDIFEAAGSALDRHVRLHPLDVLARHAWGEQGRLDLFADIDRTADAIGAFAGAGEAAGYRRFCMESRSIYNTLVGAFLTAQKPGPLALAGRIGPGRPQALLGIRPFDSLWRALRAHFRDPRLLQLFGRYATYCGSSPFAAPATLMLIAHVEQAGVWVIEGGMQRLAEALESLAVSLGVVFRYGAHVDQIYLEQGRAGGVILAGGERIGADGVVVNADAAALAGGAFGEDARAATPSQPAKARSLSAVTWALRTRARGFPLARHNVFFSNDYAAEFGDIFQRGRLPRDPTIYVCAQDRADLGQDGAEDGSKDGTESERLLVLVNAPANGDQGGLSSGALATCEKRVFDHLAECGLALSADPNQGVMTTPAMFNAMFPSTGGALYGRAMHGWSAAFERPGAATRIAGLYLAGGGAHPGAGVPMAALSGRLAAQRLMGDRASTRRFHPAAMSGGTSTRSATMVGTGLR